ncbi:YceI family protein [Chitinophaga horti]|uniref:YceI family protein n=1 Tax=Chitinophaga horti TaxID=2920382 RepID=A0ABY6J1J4_9BACT|nr:YceI family protein [Chitinophaga horti]UYQ92231.1 YceI family protein [Chitinophaga horti]
MKRLFYALALVIAVAASAFKPVAGIDWKIAGGYSIKFSAGEAAGIFKELKGTISFDESNLNASKFNVTIPVASINTGNALMNKHAKGTDWFDAGKYPNITFTSSKIVKAGAGYQAQGTLEMHGVKKAVNLPFTFKKAGNGGVFTGTFTVNRNDFRIGEAGGDVSNEIKLEVTVPVTK